MYRSLFSRDIFSEMDRLQRELQQAFELTPSIRGLGQGGFPALNVGGTPHAVEIYAFAPGLAPEEIEINLDRGILTISGERKSDLPESGEKVSVHINERFSGRFRRVISLPDTIDPDKVSANYRDGILHISIKRQESASPRRITIQ
ncbi:MAG: Hsp20/alpha crystallin family protein [Gammaproteobacteria bacterium]